MWTSWRRAGVPAVLAAGALVAPAQATPPGTNGLIAFISAAAPFQIETIAPDGSHRSGPFVIGQQPAWSPDGTRIAYAAAPAGISQLFVMNADGSGRTQLTHETTAATGASWPAWSPSVTTRRPHGRRTGRGSRSTGGRPRRRPTCG